MKKEFSFEQIYGNYNLPYYKGSYTSKDDYNFLMKFNSYLNSSCNIDTVSFVYENKKSEHLNHLNQYFNINNIMGDGNEIERLMRLKHWATSILHFDGKQLPGRIYDDLSCLEIIESAKNDGYALNCRYISLIFTQILLSAGFRSRWVVCNSMDLRDTECHCISEVYIECLQKWIVADAALGHFYFGTNGELLGLIEMRKLMTSGKKIRIFSTSINHTRTIQLYWLKNIFRFNFLVTNKYDMLKEPVIEFACLNPYGFIMENKIINSQGKQIIYKYYYDDKPFIRR